MTNSELKSKVMTLGNRLAPRMGGDRKAAFVQAWAIVKAGGLEVRASAFTLQSWKTVKKPKEFLTTKANKARKGYHKRRFFLPSVPSAPLWLAFSSKIV
jgi:hypothetical protein